MEFMVTLRMTFLGVWLLGVNWLCSHVWEYGFSTFCVLILLCGVLLGASRCRRLPLFSGAGQHASKRGIQVFLFLVLGLLVFRHGREFVRAQTGEASIDLLIDVGMNTFRADRAFFGAGRNPYSCRSQLGYRVGREFPHVEVRGRDVYMYGVRYSYGYPYFPVMFATYEPFRWVSPDHNSIRWGNGVLLLLNLIGVGILTRELVHREDRWCAMLFSSVAFLGVWNWGEQLFRAGVTDIVISTFLVFGCIFLVRRQLILSGAFLGLAQAAKLLPAPFLFGVVLLALFRKTGWRSFFGSFSLVSLGIILPFVVWDPSAFVSATVLFYLTNHGGGDSTSFWFLLPPSIRPLFLWLGVGISVGIVLLGLRSHRIDEEFLDVPRVMRLAFVSYVVFIAFNKMVHLNYLWSIWAVGCVALTAGLFRSRSASAGPSARNQMV